MSENLGDRFSRRRRFAIIVTLGLLTGLGPFTIDLYLPAFPALKLDLGIGDPQVQLTLSATIVGFAFGQLLAGPISDRFGRRYPLIIMNTVHVVASVLVASSPSYEFLAGMRALQGIGAAGGAVVAMAMARDLFSGSKLMRMLSRLALINGLAPIVAPLVGSWMVSFMSWRGIFWALAGYGGLIVVLVFVLIVETRPASERTPLAPRSLARSYRTVLSDRQFVGVWLTAAFASAGLFGYVSTSSVLLQEVFGLSEQGFGAVFAICSVGVFIGVQLGSRLSQRVGPKKILIFGTTLMVVAATMLLAVDFLTAGFIPLIPCMFAYTTGFGACMPSAQVLALENHRANSGLAASLMGALNMGLSAVVGPSIGAFELVDSTPMATAMLICALLSTAALWGIVWPLTGRRPRLFRL